MRFLAFAAALCLLTNCCLAADAPAAEKPKTKEPVPLFDGKTLDGWKIITCEAEVKDGCIFLKAGNGVVRPERKFKDYILELDYKMLKEGKYDSGIYLRCKDPDPATKFPWPKVWQVNLRFDDEGNIAEFKEARSKGLTKPNDWNHFKITVVGTKVELEINGKPAWKADGLTEPEGYISLQAEIPGGGQVLFKNITIVELNDGK